MVTSEPSTIPETPETPLNDDAVTSSDSMGNATLLADTAACREFKAKNDDGESPSAAVTGQCFGDAFGTGPLTPDPLTTVPLTTVPLTSEP